MANWDSHRTEVLRKTPSAEHTAQTARLRNHKQSWIEKEYARLAAEAEESTNKTQTKSTGTAEADKPNQTEPKLNDRRARLHGMMVAAGLDRQKRDLLYPSGPKKEATARCECGSVELKVQGEAWLSCFCHCKTCRIAGSSPMLHPLYFYTCNLACDPEDGVLGTLSGTENPSVTVTKGVDKLASHAEKWKRNKMMGGHGRVFCSECGTILMNLGFKRPGQLGNNTSEKVPVCAVFPGTFTEHLSNFHQSWQPMFHQNCESSIIPIKAFDDGLPKFLTSPGGKHL